MFAGFPTRLENDLKILFKEKGKVSGKLNINVVVN